ncbi:hypothetical protein LSAT2_030551 [Lamellibrachia satsuma]|nr:hypothetical protein LSAT2_030551 [Lamellibrachia satsuma]
MVIIRASATQTSTKETVPSERRGKKTESTKMNTQDIPELMVAVLCMELLNFVYAQNAMPDALKTTTGKFPFSLFFDVLLYFMYIEYLGVRVGDSRGVAHVAWPLAAFYALVQGEQTATNFEGIGRLMPDLLYVFLLVLVMFVGKHLGAVILK